MPSGIYDRKPEHRKKMLECLQKGREGKAREKATAKNKKNAESEEWRIKVSLATKIRMRDPFIRKKHLEGLKTARKHKMVGANGCEVTEIIKKWSNCLLPLGYIREYPIKTKGHGTNNKVPSNYKADFANIEKKIVVEIDGPDHNTTICKNRDRKKTEVLEALGWKVIRIKEKRKGA